MIEQFFMWWLDQHYILSTIFTPLLTMIWCIFKGEFLFRGLVACFIWIFFTGNASR